MIDIVPGYLSCGIKLLTKCTQSLIVDVHKIPIYAPAIHHPSASAAAGPPLPAEWFCASGGKAGRQGSPSPQRPISRTLPCCRQMAAGVPVVQ